MNISNDILYVGVNDHDIDLFEGQYIVKNGMSYNSYVILDDKIAVFDTVDRRFTKEWIENISSALDSNTPDYLIVQHMEPDHSSGITQFAELYPDATIVGSAKAFTMMKQFFGIEYEDRRIVVEDGATLTLGTHELTFLTAPMVHWPEVIVSYDSSNNVLFSADGFGKFGALDVNESWDDEARRYYIGIVGKYGAQVQALFKKIAALKIEKICPLHGPILNENLSHYIGLYDTWSSYSVEKDGIMIAYTSVYGNTAQAVEKLAQKLRAKACSDVAVYDLARCDMAEAVADAFKYGKIVLATTTYNSDIFPSMRQFIEHLTERGYKNRTIAIIENGSWAPMAAKVIRQLLEKSQNISYVDPVVKIKSALNEESSLQLESLAEELC